MSLSLDGAAVGVELAGIGDGAVVVDLSPAAGGAVQDAARPDIERYRDTVFGEFPPLSAGKDGTIAEVVHDDVVELDPDVCWPVEDPVVDGDYRVDALHYPTKRIVQPDHLVRNPDSAQDLEVAIVECVVEGLEGGECSGDARFGRSLREVPGVSPERLLDPAVGHSCFSRLGVKDVMRALSADVACFKASGSFVARATTNPP